MQLRFQFMAWCFFFSLSLYPLKSHRVQTADMWMASIKTHGIVMLINVFWNAFEIASVWTGVKEEMLSKAVWQSFLASWNFDHSLRRFPLSFILLIQNCLFTVAFMDILLSCFFSRNNVWNYSTYFCCYSLISSTSFHLKCTYINLVLYKAIYITLCNKNVAFLFYDVSYNFKNMYSGLQEITKQL